MENFQFLAKKSWYKQWWGTTIIVVLFFVIVFSLTVALLTWRYSQLIKYGYGEELKNSIYGQQQEDIQFLSIRNELEINQRPFLGNKDAKLVIVAFIDYKCPICKEQNAILQKIISKYNQQIKIIWRFFPIESLNLGASKLAEMAFCAQEQGAYWMAHNYLFNFQDKLTHNITAEDIDNFINENSLEKTQFNSCLVNDKSKTEINRDYAVGYKYGVAGTPTYFINGNKIQGNIPFETWEAIINKILNP
ncbi:MAG TPA: DsbA family protein [Candidatus Magasanikbacteria bacterium]|nr:DsbA family protein [Candidatus Magasanikbacteria bacterium]